MTELTKFKNAIDSDMTMRLQYLRILDELMTDGEITPEMISVAAKKLGFSIPASEFRSEDCSELFADELQDVNGGASPGIELAPDGRTVNCVNGYYLTWTDYWICNPEGLCPNGGVHEVDTSGLHKICKKCRLALDERGVVECYDRNGHAV